MNVPKTGRSGSDGMKVFQSLPACLYNSPFRENLSMTYSLIRFAEKGGGFFNIWGEAVTKQTNLPMPSLL